MATIKNAPCIQCLQKTRHTVLSQRIRSSEEESEANYFLECAGCGAVSMMVVWNTGDESVSYYPSPVTRRLPDWAWKLRYMGSAEESQLGELLYEIYEALRGEQLRLAVMGVRAFLEQLMISKVGDNGSFPDNLNAFEKEGYISPIQKKAMTSILDAGHGAIHRMHKPSNGDLKVALDITESITAAIYFHENDAKAVAAKVPPRKPRVKK